MDKAIDYLAVLAASLLLAGTALKWAGKKLRLYANRRLRRLEKE